MTLPSVRAATDAALARPSAEDRIRAAMWFADHHGFGVFSCWSADERGVCRCPAGATCTSAGKHPITLHGFQDATKDPARIRTQLAAPSEPNYGLVPPEGVFVWDVDSDDERARLAALAAQHGPLPATLRTDTANGQHVFLRWPEGHPRPLHKMFGLVTRWGTGAAAGYVIGPRSVHASGAVYTPVADTLEINELPPAWIAIALEGERPTSDTITIGRPLPEVGGRHDWLRDKARYYRGLIDDPVVLRATLLAENARLTLPKTEAEVDRAIGDVYSKFPADPPAEAEEKVARRLGDDDLGLLTARSASDFPADPDPLAFEGTLGDLVADVAGGTDASLVGLLGSLIAFCGALVPGVGYFHGMQTTSPFVGLVGESSVGRKSTAMTRIHDAMSEAVEAVYVNRVILDGLNSGEGLVSALHYKKEQFPYEPAVGLILEHEYAALLASRQREGSTLDPKLRAAFDGGPLSNRRSGESKSVAPPYWTPALIGITPSELRLRIEGGALQSGSANRWLYLPVRRRDVVPANEMPVFSAYHRIALQDARRIALGGAGGIHLTPVDDDVSQLLSEYADWLPGVSYGLARDLTKRLSIIAFRIALIHAVVERAGHVTRAHALRGIALTEYARSGINWVFGQTVGSPDADLLLRHLIQSGRLTKRSITQEILRDPIRRQAAIDELIRLAMGEVVTVHSTGGRPRTELVSTVSTPTSVRFVHLMRYPHHANVENPARIAQKAGSEHEPLAQKPAQNGAEQHEPLAQNLHESPPVPADPEHSAIHCLDYPAHRFGHRWSDPDSKWICPTCAEVPDAQA